MDCRWDTHKSSCPSMRLHHNDSILTTLAPIATILVIYSCCHTCRAGGRFFILHPSPYLPLESSYSQTLNKNSKPIILLSPPCDHCPPHYLSIVFINLTSLDSHLPTHLYFHYVCGTMYLSRHQSLQNVICMVIGALLNPWHLIIIVVTHPSSTYLS